MATPKPPSTTPHDPRDPSTLLCEACGYVIEGLPTDSVCPECGRPVAQSLPHRRLVSPWQNRRPGFRASVVSMVQTDIRVLRNPLTIWSAVLVRDDPRVSLSEANAATCSMIFACSVALLFVVELGSEWDPLVIVGFVLPLIIIAGIATLVLLTVLMWIERRGIRTFAALRQWRITPPVAEAVVDHASVGWLAGAIPTLLIAGLFGAGFIDVYAVLAAFAGLAALGLLTFETLVYIGFRAMRFANQHRERR